MTRPVAAAAATVAALVAVLRLNAGSPPASSLSSAAPSTPATAPAVPAPHRSTVPVHTAAPRKAPAPARTTAPSRAARASVRKAPASAPVATTAPPPPAPHPAPITPPPTSPPAQPRQFTGTTAQTPYGPVQVQITVQGGRITDVQALQLPNGNFHSQQISAYAGPRLRQEALQAQSANIDTVSGATYTSDGYRQSLQSAIDAEQR